MQLSEMRGQVLSAVRWTALSRVAMQVVTWSATLIAVRLLSPEDYGIVAAASLVSAYLALLGEVGFGSAIVQKQIRDPDTLKTIFAVLFVLSTLLGAATFLSAPAIAHALDEPPVAAVARVIALQFLLLPFGSVPEAQLRMQLRFRELGLVNLAGAVASALTVVTLALMDAGPFALVLATLASQIVRVLLLNWRAPLHWRARIELGRLRGLLRYSGLIVVERSTWYWYSEADIAIITRLLGPHGVGIFQLAKNTVYAPLERISEVLNAVSFPAFARIQQHSGAVSDAYLKAARLGSYLVFPIFWGLGAVAPQLVPVVFGAKWALSVIPLQLLAAAMPLRAVQSMSTPLMHAIGRPDVSLTTTICSLLILVPLIFLGTQHYGLPGAAGGWAVGYPFVFLISSYLFSRTLQLSVWRIWLAISRPLACGVLMAAAVLAVGHGLASAAPRWVTLLAGIATGAIVYPAGVFVLDRASFQELWGLVRGLMGRGK